jgi:hypothetical protein
LSERLDAVLAAIDEINSHDPNILLVDGLQQPKELAHARMVSDWVRRFDPEPSDAQLIAARAHHLRRWAVPRADYPEGRSGYLKWRRDQGERHRLEVAEIMADNGYDSATTEAVADIMAKRNLAGDRAAQTHEDALCLVFLQTQLNGLVERLGPEKSSAVVAKTLGKMSAHAHAAAGELAYTDSSRAVLKQALDIREGEV